MRDYILKILTLVLSFIFIAGCTVKVQSRTAVHVKRPKAKIKAKVKVKAPPPPPAKVTVRVAPPRGVIVLSPGCNPNKPEILNGIDDNCNGLIDEGFVRSGSIQITLAWKGGADMDLYVIDPTGEEIYYKHRSSRSGGIMDRDARGACTDGSIVENVYWPKGRIPRGRYRVDVKYFSDCNLRLGPQPVTVSIAYNGKVIGVYQYTLRPGQRATIATFVVP